MLIWNRLTKVVINATAQLYRKTLNLSSDKIRFSSDPHLQWKICSITLYFHVLFMHTLTMFSPWDSRLASRASKALQTRLQTFVTFSRAIKLVFIKHKKETNFTPCRLSDWIQRQPGEVPAGQQTRKAFLVFYYSLKKKNFTLKILIDSEHILLLSNKKF